MGDIAVVGIGPGAAKQCTPEADAAIGRATVVAGYTTYIALLEGRLDGKRLIATGMMREIERCHAAVDAAMQGERVAVVCSGDAGIYGMASLVLESAEGKGLDISIFPGITAACSGAALLGAPLSHDFCTISLSDLLTPQDLIDKRVRAAAMGDFCIVIYNPMSKSRRDKLSRACDILLETLRPDTVCGWTKNIGRDGEQSKILPLSELRDEEVDMFTTVFIGNSQTRAIDGRMVTPRGYENKTHQSRH